MKKFIRQVPIRVKLLIMGSVPLIMLIYLCMQVLKERRDKTELLRSFISRIQQSENLGQLISSLQDERRYSFDYALQANWQKELLTARLKTDKYLSVIIASKDDAYEGLQEFTRLGKLLETRNSIDSNKLNANQVMQFYTSIIFRLNTLNPIPYLTKVYLKPVHHYLVAQKILSEIITYFGIVRSNIYNVLHTRSYMVETLFGTMGAWEVLTSNETELKHKVPTHILNEYEIIREDIESKKVFGYMDMLFTTFKFDSTYSAEQWWQQSESVSDKFEKLRIHFWQEASGQMNEQYRREQQSNDRMLALLIVIMLFVLGIIIYSFLLINRDATAMKKIILQKTADLREKNKELVRSNHELEQFAYVASHDLQEPLRKIQTFTDIVLHEPGQRSDTEKYLLKINNSASRMSELINAVLNFSRISKSDEHYERVDLNQIMKNVIADLELLIAEKKAKITINPLPVTFAVRLQMHQLFSNLVMNALKFSNGNPEITISSRDLKSADLEKYSSLNKSNRYFELTFTDNGIGFEQGYAQQIFTIFRRLHDRQTYQGTGIGLALCKKIVENHDGIIMAEGNPGKGATFRVILPFRNSRQ